MAAAVKEHTDERENSVKRAVVCCSGQAACAGLGEEPVEGVGVVVKEKVDVEAGGERLLLNGGKNGVGVFENGGVEEKERILRVGETMT